MHHELQTASFRTSSRLARALLLIVQGKRHQLALDKSPRGQLGPRDAACSVVGPMGEQHVPLSLIHI